MPTLKHMAPILQLAHRSGASDVHIVAGVPPAFRIDGEIILADAPAMTREKTKELAYEMLNDLQRKALERDLEICFSMEEKEFGRFRVSVYHQAGNPELSIRRCNTEIPTREELGLPEIVEELARRRSGLLLITGPTGSGKTTTLNYMVDMINSERRCKIITIEDPIEFVHQRKRAIIVQQEVHTDVHSFSKALIHILRQDADVICIGEMRDLETIGTALVAAETGHLVIATVHTPNAALTIERIVSVFPPEQQNQVIAQLSNSIEAIVAQRLLPRADKKGRALAVEIMVTNLAVRTIIRENELHKLASVLETGKKLGMQTMDECLRDMYERAEITYDTAVSHARDPKSVRIESEASGQI